MKGIRIVLAVLLCYRSVTCVADGGTGTIDLHEMESTVGQILERNHYTQRKLDSDMAKEILETYLERLDYNKLFFTQEDIDLIRNEYRSGLDDDILLGNLTAAKAIYAMFKQRVDQRVGPSELNEFKIDTQITISGIGVQTRVEKGYATIVRIVPGGPAARSGKLHIGDLIVGVAEGDRPFVNTAQTERDKLTEMVLGKDGSVVHLQLISGHGNDPSKRRIVTLVRRKMRLTEEEAHAQLIERPTAGGSIQKLGWITVPSFYGEPDNSIKTTSVARDVTMLLKRLEREGIQGGIDALGSFI